MKKRIVAVLLSLTLSSAMVFQWNRRMWSTLEQEQRSVI